MKVALLSSGEDLHCQIDEEFGRAKYIILIDSEKDTWEVAENDVPHEHRGRFVANIIISLKAEAAIVSHIGPVAFALLKEKGIKVFNAQKISVKEAIDLYRKGQLKQLDKETGPSRKIMDYEN